MAAHVRLDWHRASAPPAETTVRRVGRVALTPAHSVHVVEVAGKSIVIGCHPGGMTVLGPGREGGE
jgi:flagellar biogenesis protein FliO